MRCFRLWLAATLVFCLAAASPWPDAKPQLSNDAARRLPLPPLSSDGVRVDMPDDPVDFVQLRYPLDGSVEKAPVELLTKIGIHVGSTERFAELYSGARVCVEVNGVTNYCSDMGDKKSRFLLHDLGTFTVRAYIAAAAANSSDASAPVYYWQSSPATFSVVSTPIFDAHVASLIAEGSERYSVCNLTLVQWAKRLQRRPADDLLLQLKQDRVLSGIAAATQPNAGEKNVQTGEEPLELVIGIKTAVTTNFQLRQAMRQTWANATSLPRGVRVFFLGCRPFASIVPGEDPVEMENRLRRVREAIELEKCVYGDLLTHELDCDDMYLGLADKVKEFLHFAAVRYTHAPHVMLADDDVYLDVENVLHKLRQHGQRERFYSGQVRALENAQVIAPVRNADERYRLSEADYPLNELPPFALGAYYFLSMDCAQFVAKNHRHLQGLGGMDDISVALWMLTIQVHPQRFSGRLEHLRAGPCEDALSAFGDLSPLAIHTLHDNLLTGRPFCHGFQQHSWLKPKSQAPRDGVYRQLPRFSESLQFAIFYDERSNTSVITVIVSTPRKAGVKLQYVPSQESPNGFMRRVCARARLHFPGAASAFDPCTEVTAPLRVQLLGDKRQR